MACAPRHRKLKGRRFELETTTDLQVDGFDAQHVGKGSDGGVDVVATLFGDTTKLQCKWNGENYYKLRVALERANIVVHRDNRKEPLVTMTWETFKKWAKLWHISPK